MSEDSLTNPCGFCRDQTPKQVLYQGKVAFGTKCTICGATSQYSSRALRNQALSVTPAGFEHTPLGMVAKMLKDPIAFFRPGRNKNSDNQAP